MEALAKVNPVLTFKEPNIRMFKLLLVCFSIQLCVAVCFAEKSDTPFGPVVFTTVDKRKSVSLQHEQFILLRTKLSKKIHVVSLRDEGDKNIRCSILRIVVKGDEVVSADWRKKILFEKYKIEKRRGEEFLVDDGGSLFFEVDGVKVEWSYSSADSSYIYVDGGLEYAVVSAKSLGKITCGGFQISACKK